MKRFKLLVLLLMCQIIGFSQKPTLNYDAIKNWPAIRTAKISNDGKFVLYYVLQGARYSLMIRSVDNSFNREIDVFSGTIMANFTEDSRRVVFLKSRDTLDIVDLTSGKEVLIPNCLSFAMPGEGTGEWLAYQLANMDLMLLNFFSGKTLKFPEVKSFLFSESGNMLLIVSEFMKDGSVVQSLKYANLINGKVKSICEARHISNFVLDKVEKRLAFIFQDIDIAQPSNDIMIYDLDLDTIRHVVKSDDLGLGEQFEIKSGKLKFSCDSERVFFRVIQTKAYRKQSYQDVNVNVWSFKDPLVQLGQLESLKFASNKTFVAVANVSDGKVIQLEQEGDKTTFDYKINEGKDGNFLLVSAVAKGLEGYKDFVGDDIYLVNTKDGSRICIAKNFSGQHRFSPGGKYVYWYDKIKRAYFTFNIDKREIRNVSRLIPTSLSNELSDIPGYPFEYGVAAWLTGDEALVIYDRYDIWLVDPNGKKKPVNITNGYGRANGVIMRYVNINNSFSIDKSETLIISGFNERYKLNGFYKKEIGQKGNPLQLIMSPAIYYLPGHYSGVSFQDFLLKSKNANVFLMKRMSSTEYPNLVCTKDFSNFTTLSDLYPHKAYNWFTCELIEWEAFDGRHSQGILYKPENFNPNRKYPVIFYFYERHSDALHMYQEPTLSSGTLNIPYFVSNGYLVFCPDIYYTIGEPGESAYNFVVSAAKMLSRKTWVDSTLMGLQGHSWGGYQVNYLISRTKIFAAAASAAGSTDWVSSYFTLEGGIPHEAFGQFELGQSRIGSTFWERQELYIKNSPLFKSNMISTPLLVMHNDNDRAVPWTQGIELYLALRRLGKAVWMLQYEGQGHVLTDEASKLDFSIRMSQFFDHYLKKKPAPKWMTKGVQASSKGIETGLDLDIGGTCLKNCQICLEYKLNTLKKH